jgi:very-short-patch-repair endonuclease
VRGRRGIINKMTDYLYNSPNRKDKRVKLRKNLTPAEARLWTLIKNCQLDHKKFRRQASVGNYILDFYCSEEKLAVELDGQGHYEKCQSVYDEERTKFLNSLGIKVLRFENRIVWENSDWLIQEIKNNFRNK